MPQPLIQIDARAALRSIGRVGPALQRGAVRGINDVAFKAMRFERGQLPKRLDRPSKFTERGVQVDRAAATQAVPEATVKISDQRAKYLARQEFGGEMTRDNASATRGSGSDAIVVPVADIVTNALGSAGRNAVKRALKLRAPIRRRLVSISVTGLAGWARCCCASSSASSSSRCSDSGMTFLASLRFASHRL